MDSPHSAASSGLYDDPKSQIKDVHMKSIVEDKLPSKIPPPLKPSNALKPKSSGLPVTAISITREIEQALKADFEVTGPLHWTKTTTNAPFPGLVIDGFGPLGLPITGAEAQRLWDHCQRTPLPVIQSHDSRSLKIPGAEVSFKNPAWAKYLGTALSDACTKLRVNMSNVTAQHEVLGLVISDTGSPWYSEFEPNLSEGAFARLAIILPCSFEGGNGRIVLDNLVEPIKINGHSPYSTRAIAWLKEASHEFAPITTGHTVTVLCNIRLSTPVSPRSKANAITRLQKTLSHWRTNLEVGPQKIVFLLDDQTMAVGFNPKDLYGKDARMLAVLSQISSELPLGLGLATITHEVRTAAVTGELPASEYDSELSNWHYRRSTSPSRAEATTVTTIKWLKSPLGTPIISELPVTGEELIPTELCSLLRPRTSQPKIRTKVLYLLHYSYEATETLLALTEMYETFRCNFGYIVLTLWTVYQGHAIVIWPKEHDEQIRYGLAYPELALQALYGEDTSRIPAWYLIRYRDSSKVPRNEAMITICQAACRWGDIKMWRSAVACFDGASSVAALGPQRIIDSIKALGLVDVLPTVEAILGNDRNNTRRWQLLGILSSSLHNLDNDWINSQWSIVLRTLGPIAHDEISALIQHAFGHGDIAMFKEVILPQLCNLLDGSGLLACAKMLWCRSGPTPSTGMPEVILNLLQKAIEKTPLEIPAAYCWSGQPDRDCESTAQHAERLIRACIDFNGDCFISTIIDPLVILMPHNTSHQLQVLSALLSKLTTLFRPQPLLDIRSPCFTAFISTTLGLVASSIISWRGPRDDTMAMVGALVQAQGHTNDLKTIIIPAIKSHKGASDTSWLRRFLRLLLSKRLEAPHDVSLTEIVADLMETVADWLCNLWRKQDDLSAISNWVDFYLDSGNTENCAKLLSLLSGIRPSANKTSHKQILSLIYDIAWAFRTRHMERMITTPCIKSLFKAALAMHVEDGLGLVPPPMYTWNDSSGGCRKSCSSCDEVHDFLGEQSKSSLELEDIKAIEVKHVERRLRRMKLGDIATWRVVSSTPRGAQGLEITKTAKFLKASEWSHKKDQIIATIKSFCSTENAVKLMLEEKYAGMMIALGENGIYTEKIPTRTVSRLAKRRRVYISDSDDVDSETEWS